MFGRNNDNGDAPPAPPQGPQEPVQLIPQRTIRVEYVDGSGVAQHGTIACRLIRDAGTVTIFSDAIQTPVGYQEFIVLAVATRLLVSYREVVALVGSSLVN